jgi:RecQ-mediated genome instability protein 1
MNQKKSNFSSFNKVCGHEEGALFQEFVSMKYNLQRPLLHRLPLLPEPEVQEVVDEPPLENQPPPPEPASARSPLRDISPPPEQTFPQRDDDANLEPRRRVPTRSVLQAIPDPSSGGERKIVPLPSRNSQTSSDHHKEARRPSMAERSTLIYAGSQNRPATSSSTAASSGYELRSSAFEVNKVVEHLDFNMKPTGRQLLRTLPSPSPEPPALNQGARLEPSPFDFDLADEIDENKPLGPPRDNDKGKGPMEVDFPTKGPANGGDYSSDDYGFMDDESDFADANFLGDLDRVEKAALEASSNASGLVPVSSSASASVGTSSSLASSFVMVDNDTGTVAKPASEVATKASDVIEIDDSDEEMLEADDKENQPVPTRHVRRRTEAGIAGPAFTQHRSQRLTQKPKGPVVLADDIIDISD